MRPPPIDGMYAAFVASLPTSLRGTAADLPYLLKLAPAPGIGFGSVFSHEVTLAAPWLIAEAFPGLSQEAIERAVLAHAFSVIEAFGRDRLADQQVAPAPELLDVLEALRMARNLSVNRVSPEAEPEMNLADAQTRTAIDQERSLLAQVTPVSFQEYETISLGKQAVGFPASLALARAAGATPSQLQQVEALLGGVWLGLQFEDDVIDWEDDWQQQRAAWAVCLALGVRHAPVACEPSEPSLVRRLVLRTSVLPSMLERALQRYSSARRAAEALGALRLARWAAEREVKAEAMIAFETRYAGYAVRNRRLAHWAAEVLA